MTSLNAMLQQTPYVSYSYSYPHKTAYRVFDRAIPLRDLWAQERRDTLFLYFHIPFCEMRCGFCNLFTTVNHKGDLQTEYLAAFARQARRIRAALGESTFARFAIGGGTPTLLEPGQLHTLFDLSENLFGVDLAQVPISVETSPKTSEAAKLQVLRERGVDRISIGVQSFVEEEVSAVGRSQRTSAVEVALDRIRAAGFPTLNIDLMYGLPGQTLESWLGSLRTALHFAPEELYLYPLYVRPLTGLGRQDKSWDDLRLEYYRAGRDLLRDAGYQQVSMRMFQASHASALDGPVYCCQADGMVGVGCGARSYTRDVHYSNEYAVSSQAVRAILSEYVTLPTAAFDLANYGVRLTREDQRRRYVIQALLQSDGLDLGAYYERFGMDVFEEMPQLAELLEYDLATCADSMLVLNDAGMERSDTIGPWLYAAQVCDRMEAFTLL